MHKRLSGRVLGAFERFFRVEAASGIVLLGAALLALWWANSPFGPGYEALWHTPWRVAGFTVSLHFLTADVLMTVFFLAVGLEIRREMHEGALRQPRQAALPVAAAFGGVLAPALIYLSLTDSAAQAGWAVPTATDIAFAVGVLALLGRCAPGNARVFLLALAIIDDLIAILIIALFYSEGLDYHGFMLAALGVALVFALQRGRVDNAYAYVPPGALIWLGLLMAGAPPALAGVMLGLLTPVSPLPPRPDAPQRPPPLTRVETALHPWVAYGVMPLFALANAGVSLGSVDMTAASAREIMLAVMLALVIGKPLGVVSVSWLLVRLRWCRLPSGLNWNGVMLVGLLAGVGFTMSIFIALLAFVDDNPLNAAKLGVLLGSCVSAVLGLAWGLLVRPRQIKS